MMKSVFCTTAPIGRGHGGGIVSFFECQALKETSEIIQVLCPDADLFGLPVERVSTDGHYQSNPFFYDYLSSMVAKKADVAFFNGAPFTATLMAINPSKVIVDCPAHNLSLSIEEWQKQKGNYPFTHMVNPFLWHLYTDFIKNADMVICPSRMSAECLKQNPGTRAELVVIPHGTDLPEVKPIPEDFKVGYIGACGPDKGNIYLFRAWAGLMYPDSELILAGGGWTNEKLPDIFKKGQRISMPGRVANISDFYNQISLYVQPSVTEGFGIPVLEAMAHGRPVIVSEGAGASELVSDGQEGFKVPIRDAVSIAERIDWLKKRPDTLKEMGIKARKKAEQYTWQRASDEIQKALKGLLCSA